jgi:hypothetical protein
MISIPDFYPTPVDLIRKMLSGIKLEEINTILEPSAGKGGIIDYIVQKIDALSSSWSCNKRQVDIDCIEIDENLQHILKGKGYRVVHDDFLTFSTFKRYDLIVMNPPFSDGEKHLLKALEIQQNGGRIVCLFNAETIRNPFSNARKDLVRKLDELNAEIEFIQGAFIDAERKTGVEIAMIKVNIPAGEKRSFILDDLKRGERFTRINRDDSQIVEADFFENIVHRYNFEVQAGLNLIDEYLALEPFILEKFKENGGDIKTIALSVDGAKHDWEMGNTYIKKIRYQYWKALFDSDNFSKIFTTKLRSAYYERLKDLEHYDFSLYNIYSIKAELVKSMSSSIEETIIALFDDFSHKHHWHDETSKNIHFYNGWKTNQAWYINKRIVIPYMKAFNDWSGKFDIDYQVKNKLADIEKVFDYLDGARTDHIDLETELKRAGSVGQTSKIPLKYFKITFYKKGTAHIEFTNPDLLKKFNLFGSQRKGWLPPSYGKATYEDMTQEEKTVVDEFEGAAEYRKVLAQKDYFICKSIELPMLEERAS